MDLTYLPLAAAGLARSTACTSACGVLHQLLVLERELADRHVDDRGLVHAELDLAGLDLLDRARPRRRSPCRSWGWASGPRGPRTFPSLPTSRIMSGVAMTASKSIQPSWIFLTISGAADEIGAGRLGLLGLLAAGDDQHALGLARAVGQHDRAADHLVGVLAG